MERKFDLEDRLVEFAAQIIRFTDTMVNSKSANHMAGQLLRTGTSPALNYGEAQAGESRRDFIHKLKIILKELRESRIALKVIDRAKIHSDLVFLQTLREECNQLIAIETANRNSS